MSVVEQLLKENFQTVLLTVCGLLFIINVLITLVYLRERSRQKAALDQTSLMLANRATVIENLTQERNLLRNLIDHSPDYICAIDMGKRILITNSATSELKAKSPAKLVDCNDDAVLATGQALINVEQQIQTTAGDQHTLLISRVPLRDEHNEIIGLATFSRDITEYKVMERQLLDLNVERERVQFLENFLINMSHDFRTPLSIISTSAYLAQKTPDMAQRQHHLSQLETQIKSMGDILEAILKISHLEYNRNVARFDQLDLNEFVQKIVTEFEPVISQRQQQLTFAPTNPLPAAWAYDEELRWAVWNLIENAIQYTPQQGQIQISTYALSQYVVLSIKDNGIGITPDDVSHIFDYFYQANKARTSGTGMGLAIVRKIAQIHNGYIAVDSTLGVGSTFSLAIPIHQSTAGRIEQH